MKKRSRKKVMGTQTSFEDDLAYHEQCPLTTLLKCLPQFGGMVELYFGCKLCEFGSLYQGEQTFLQHVNSCHAQHSQPPDPLQRCDKVLEPGWDSLPDVCQAEGSIQTSLTAATSTSVVEKARQLSQAPNEDSQLYENTIGEIILEEQEVSFEGQVELGIDIKHEMSATDCEELRESEPMPNEAAGAKMADQQGDEDIKSGDTLCQPTSLEEPKLILVPKRVRRRRNRRTHKCTECDFVGQKYDVNTHMTVHTGEKLYQCDVCGKAYGWRQALAEHRATHSGHTAEWVCEQCGKCFAQRRNLAKHYAVHSKERRFACHACDKAYGRRDSLTAHIIRTHDKTYSRRAALAAERTAARQETDNTKALQLVKDGSAEMRVLNIVTEDQPESVSKKTVSSGLQQETMKIYKTFLDGKRFYRCPTCDKCFKFSHSLKAHLRIHTSERPYKCDVCGQSFKQRAHMTYHRMIHDDVRPHECPVCHLRFRARSKLHRHMRRVSHSAQT